MSQWVIGLDYSMTCPAITIINRDGPFEFDRCQLHYISDKVEKNVLENVKSVRLPDYNSNEERFDIISNWAVAAIQSTIQQDPVELFMEGYAMSGKGRVFEIAENTGLVKHKLWKLGHDIKLLPPTVVKKFATGKGNSDKDLMYAAFLERTKIPLMQYYQPKAKNVGSPVGDLVDSFFIALCGWEGI